MSTSPVTAPRARSSLARSTLIKMGVRVGVIIALTTLVSYFHIFRSFRTEALSQLERAVTDHSQREEVIFVLAQDNHARMAKALEERFQAWLEQDPNPRFDSLFTRQPDGTIRNRREGFDGTKQPGVYIPRGVKDDADFRRRTLAAYDMVSQYGPAYHVRFVSTGVMLPEGTLVGYFPAAPNYFLELEPTFSILNQEYFTLGLPENNPQRKPAWTGIFEDVPTRTWMVTVVTPVDVGGRHIGTISHDVLLDELMVRTLNIHLPQAYNLLFRDDGLLIAHPHLRVKGGVEPYNILSDTRKPEEVFEQGGSEQQRAHLRAIFEAVKARPPDQIGVELKDHGEYLAAARLRGPHWNFVTVQPEHVVSSDAFGVARYVLMFGLVSLLVELAIMSWVLRQQISRPLVAFTQATDQVAAGDFKVSLESSRDDELGRLASAFRLMAQEVQRREEALRQANEGLEQRVVQRTQELTDVHRQLVETARQVGRAEIATNVLHNVGNVLNSVLTSTMVAQERLAAMKIENVERTVDLMEEHRAELSAFVTQDPRGRNALPFLRKTGQHLQAQRQELQTLLGDVSRHTEHIGAIVKLQQDYAKLPMQMIEPVKLGELVEDAVRINQAALSRHSVKVELNMGGVPDVLTEKHKVLMILVNLISNAKHALDSIPDHERRLTVSVSPGSDDRVRIEVRDNGVGIAPEVLHRIFQRGFTTRQGGHGFGLHSSALAAQELGGALSVHSDGVGKGASFALELPVKPQAQSEPSHA
ncbi:ATP-binding protein [Hyalangium gracile]|uniref:ATP-binding protein n=1 Tax=Hyalangium gracile TaxID=394092 RepID=UPI001CC965C3|nr:ATP-binding protein [Hyalangium gracile]